MSNWFTETSENSIPLIPLSKDGLDTWRASTPPAHAAWATQSNFTASAGSSLSLPDADGNIAAVLVGLGNGEAADADIWAWGGPAKSLPAGHYHIASDLEARAANHAALGWALGQYQFTRYKKGKDPESFAQLVWPAQADRAWVMACAEASTLTRDLVNIPAEDLGPAELVQAVVDVANRFGAQHRVISGDALLAENFSMIHTVGRGSDRAPALVDMSWGDPNAPKITIVGKGVIFDTGGYNLKPGGAMGLMKKDMGGAANALGLAQMIMQMSLPVRLRLIIPAVENSVSGRAFRPGDVIPTRAGISVEIGNTDAEGRLILADALALADEDRPDMLLDFATLTGAARVALGGDIPAMFTPDHELAALLSRTSAQEGDPLWRLPLWSAYAEMLDSKIADINNSGTGGFAGSITAALFLQRFVRHTPAWAHFDMYAWNQKNRPGRPAGGEAMCLRASYAAIKEKLIRDA